MDDKFYLEIDPLDKEEELLTVFKEYNPKSYSRTEEGVEDLQEDDAKYIVFTNPYYDCPIVIDLGDMEEFTVYFAENHAHYSACQGYYEYMLETLKKLFSNALCAGSLFDTNGKWFGSCWVEKEDLDKDIEEIFHFVFKEKELERELTQNGYEAEFKFWNPIDNKKIQK